MHSFFFFVWYRRYTSPETFESYNYLTSYWYSDDNTMANDDFGLYSSLSDAINDVNEWTYCNYDDCSVGFPRDCGPTGYVAWQWNTNDPTRAGTGQQNIQFSIYTGDGVTLDLSKMDGKGKTDRTKSKKNKIVTYWYDAQIIVGMQRFFKIHPSVGTIIAFLVGIAFTMIISHGYGRYTKE